MPGYSNRNTGGGGGGSGLPTDLTYNDVTHTLLLDASEDGGDVEMAVSNSSNTANSGARLKAIVAGTSAGKPGLDLNTPGGTNWAVEVDRPNSYRFEVIRGGTQVMLRMSSETAGTVQFGSVLRMVQLDSGQIPIMRHVNGSPAIYMNPSGLSLECTGDDVALGLGVIATNATVGFPKLRTCAGTPTGAAANGCLVVDTTNNKLCFRSGGSWISLP